LPSIKAIREVGNNIEVDLLLDPTKATLLGCTLIPGQDRYVRLAIPKSSITPAKVAALNAKIKGYVDWEIAIEKGRLRFQNIPVSEVINPEDR
jgi:hypothetical protein